MSTVLVTGAAGFIGSHTVDRLLEQGCRVIGVDNFRTGRSANLKDAWLSEQFTFSKLDVTDEGTVGELVANARPEVIIHLAALVSVQESIREPSLNFRSNLAATHYLAEAARRHGVKRFVFASSAAIYGDTQALPIREETPKQPLSPYGGAKLASEDLLQAYAASYGIVTVCHRYFNVYGPRQDPSSPYSGVISIFRDRLAAERPITIFGDGEQTRDFISVHDVARANVNSALSSDIQTGSYNICTGRSTSLHQLAELFFAHFPDSAPLQYTSSREGDIRHSLGDPQTASKDLGFKAHIALKEGLKQWLEGVHRDANG